MSDITHPTVEIQIRVINTSRAVWGEDAETFRPSRWLDLPADYSANYHLMSFIQGPHACIGKTMSILEMKAVLACVSLPLSLFLSLPRAVPLDGPRRDTEC